MINQSIPRSEDEESLHQEGRLQSVAVLTESLRLDVSSMQRNIETHNGTIDLLLKCEVADRDERKVMVAKITEQDGRIGDLNSTIPVQGVRIAEQDVGIGDLNSTIAVQGVRIAKQDMRIAEQDVRIGDLNSTIAVQGVRIAEQDVRIGDLNSTIAVQGVRIAEQDVRIDRQERNSDLYGLIDWKRRTAGNLSDVSY
jgi:uncharacterized coiled-coil protein SlyX